MLVQIDNIIVVDLTDVSVAVDGQQEVVENFISITMNLFLVCIYLIKLIARTNIFNHYKGLRDTNWSPR